MMRAFALLFTMAAVATAQAKSDAKVDLTGSWAFTVTYDGGSGSPTVTLQQKGDTLVGRYSSQAFGELEVVGSVKGKEFTFAFTAGTDGQSFTMTLVGEILDADNVRGTADLGGNGTATFVGKRNKQQG